MELELAWVFASIVIYVASYRGVTMDGIARWAIVLYVGIICSA